MPDRSVFLLTVKDLLNAVSNDYSEAEEVFQTGNLPLVDDRPLNLLADGHGIERKWRDSYIRPTLYANSPTPTISVIIPTFGGERELSECLDSVSRQSFAIERAAELQVVVVEDGIPKGNASAFDFPGVRSGLEKFRRLGIEFKLLRLSSNHQRAQARNAGLAHADREIVLFVDSSMVLDSEFIAEHMFRHGRLHQRAFALLGFKENISWKEFELNRSDILTGARRPQFGRDLKCSHLLSFREAGSRGFDCGNNHFSPGDTINYMKETNYLRGLSAIRRLGNRTLPSFFQTNIVSVRRDLLVNAGGFEPSFQNWGLEDTFLGAVLLGTGCRFIPCPSGVAFNIEDRQKFILKSQELAISKRKYLECLTRFRMIEQSSKKFHENERFLRPKTEVVEWSRISKQRRSNLNHSTRKSSSAKSIRAVDPVASFPSRNRINISADYLHRHEAVWESEPCNCISELTELHRQGSIALIKTRRNVLFALPRLAICAAVASGKETLASVARFCDLKENKIRTTIADGNCNLLRNGSRFVVAPLPCKVVALDWSRTLVDEFDLDEAICRFITMPRQGLEGNGATNSIRLRKILDRLESEGSPLWYDYPYLAKQFGWNESDLRKAHFENAHGLRSLCDISKFVAELRKRGIQTALLTNCVRKVLDWRAEMLGLRIDRLFDNIITSDEVGFCQDKSRHLDMLSDEMRLPSSAIVMVGDNLNKDILPAKARRMGTIWVNLAPHRDRGPSYWGTPEMPTRPHVYELSRSAFSGHAADVMVLNIRDVLKCIQLQG